MSDPQAQKAGLADLILKLRDEKEVLKQRNDELEARLATLKKYAESSDSLGEHYIPLDQNEAIEALYGVDTPSKG